MINNTMAIRKGTKDKQYNGKKKRNKGKTIQWP
jgi:hypothetical protein